MVPNCFYSVTSSVRLGGGRVGGGGMGGVSFLHSMSGAVGNRFLFFNSFRSLSWKGVSMKSINIPRKGGKSIPSMFNIIPYSDSLFIFMYEFGRVKDGGYEF